MRPLADGRYVLIRLDFARSTIVRVLQADQPRPEQVLVVRPNEPANLVQVQHAELPFHRSCH